MPFFYKRTSAGGQIHCNVYGHLRKPLFAWQKECLDIRFANQGKGVVMSLPGQAKLSWPWEQSPGWNICIQNNHPP
jgi:hypothetical protein